MEISFQKEGNYLLVKAQGVLNPDTVREGLEDLRERAMQAGVTRILINAKEVIAPKIEFHRYLFGESMAKLLPPPLKVAVLYKAELITKFSENTAVNRGADLYICSNEIEALEWLLGALPTTHCT
jgi:hypothetical protein